MIEKIRAHWHRELIYLGLAAMESCWLHPWLLFLLGKGVKTRHVPWAALLALLLLALYLTRFLDQKVTSLQTQRLVTIALAPLSTLLLLRVYVYAGYRIADLSWLVQFVWEVGNLLQRIPPSLIIFLAGLCLWWRGISLAQRVLDVASVGLSFRIGIIAFFWLFLFRILGSPTQTTVYAFAYFFLALIVMGLARVQDIRQSHVGIRSPFNASWMGILVGAAFTALTLSILAARLLSLRTVAALLDWLSPVIAVLGKAAHPVLAVLAALLDFILNFLIRIFSAIFGAQDQEALGLDRLAERLREIQPPETLLRNPSLILQLALQILKWGFLGLLFLGALAVLAFTIDRGWRALQDARSAEYESVREGESIGKDAKDALESRWQKLREELEARLAKLRGEEYALASIRQIYASLVKLATVAGFPRQEAETPYEYIASLHQAFPESDSEIMLITDAYVHTHYGEQRFRPEYVQRVREAWLTIRNRERERESFRAYAKDEA